jgi:hypothetical protein
MIQCGGVMMLPGGVAATRRRKGGDDACCADVNLTGQTNEENLHDRFNCYKW